jgi:Phosphoribosyl transferase (PRTase)
MASSYFSGSYPESDVRFLLHPIPVENTPIHLKEALIQSGRKHYSELLTHELLPSIEYLNLFQQALTDNRGLMALHTLKLAKKILATRPNGVTLVSLARAGTPIGVLLKRVLKHYFAVDPLHYSISIIRDIGIDENALLHILEHHAPESLVFVDGWTGKGVIANQLITSLKDVEDRYHIKIKPELYVLSDLCGSAAVSASSEDYLIPSSILNATVSGLVSRSVIDKTQLSKTDFHGCYFYKDYNASDFSSTFVDVIMDSVDEIVKAGSLSILGSQPNMADVESVKQAQREQSQQYKPY